jgi:hypothetical protein
MGTSETIPVAFETVRLRKEEGVVFATIAAPRMNLLGPELVRDLVSLIQRAECARSPEAQGRTQTAMKRGFQTRDAEMDLARMVGELSDH